MNTVHIYLRNSFFSLLSSSQNPKTKIESNRNIERLKNPLFKVSTAVRKIKKCGEAMVFPGEEEDYTATTGPQKKKTLHNFSFTDLKWGAQRNLRCTKIESDGGGSPVAVAADRRLRRRSSPRSRGSENGGEEGIGEAKEDEEERRNKKEGEREVSPPWNLRKRRAAACKAPIRDSGGNNQNDEKGFGEENGVVRPKFVSTLLKKEVEDDYMAMVGHRPPRRPKKRHRNVQKQIDSLYPAFYFGEVTEDIYDVPDAAENGKK